MQAQIARDSEVSAVSVAANLLGFPERICNHQFYRLNMLPFLVMVQQSDAERGHDDPECFEITNTTADSEYVTPSFTNGKVCASNARWDYLLRPQGLEKISLYDFTQHYQVVTNYFARHCKGRRFQLMPGHPQRETHCVIERPSAIVPVVHGPSIPNSEKDRAKFAQYVLTLHKPFRDIAVLRGDEQNWIEAFDELAQNCSPRVRRLIQNILGIADANRAHKSDLQKKIENPNAGNDVPDEVWHASPDE